MLYVVSHDCSSIAEHQRAAAYIQSVSKSCWSHVDGVWFIDSDCSGVELRRGLKSALEQSARIVVAMLAGFAAWQGFDSDTEIWLARHL